MLCYMGYLSVYHDTRFQINILTNEYSWKAIKGSPEHLDLVLAERSTFEIAALLHS